MQAKRLSIQKTDGAVYSTECMMCGECIGKCPAAGAARLTLFGKTLTESKPGRKSPDSLKEKPVSHAQERRDPEGHDGEDRDKDKLFSSHRQQGVFSQ